MAWGMDRVPSLAGAQGWLEDAGIITGPEGKRMLTFGLFASLVWKTLEYFRAADFLL